MDKRQIIAMNPVEMLQKRLKKKTRTKLAEDLGISLAYLRDVLAGHRDPGPKVIRALGLERVVTYQKVG